MTHAIASRYPARSGEQGFTLVELAIVLIIIGLLIGGILKGQELIANAQIKSVVSQIKGFDAAVTTFRDSYGALPGDMAGPAATVGPQVRLPNCPAGSICASLGNGNNQIDSPALGAVPVAASEGFVMWSQLAAADIISGIQGTAIAFPNGALPAASIGGGFWAGHTSNTGAPSLTGGNALNAGQYFVFNGTVAAVGAGSGGLQPLQAQRIDRTMDDGLPNTGTVRAAGDNGAAGCAAGGVVGSLYNNAAGANTCALYIRFQG